MARSVVTRKRNAYGGTKVKTGCTTCRIRKIKCDESKPSCLRCVNTGRTCDGYSSLFRFSTSQSINKPHMSSVDTCLALRPSLTEITQQEIDLLNRYFSIKTVFDVELSCDEEAKQVLQASLTDPPIRHAISSLKALRKDFETSGDSPSSIEQQNNSYDYGLQQYSIALRGLASKLSSPGFNELNSALLCCQIFISIEQVQMNYTAMVQHIIRGLSIMREYRVRPCLTAANELLPAHHNQLPLLDIFIIKLFAAPCKFAEPASAITVNATTSPDGSISPDQQSVKSCEFRTIAPDMRTELTRIAAITIELLDKISRVQSKEIAVQLLSEKEALLDTLELWLADFVSAQDEVGSPGPEPVSASFMRLFYLILRIILLGMLDSSSDLHVKLQVDNDELQDVAGNVGERLKAYKMSGGTRGT